MAAALTRVAGVHQALWTYDSWYRYAWFLWPQALSLLVVTLVFSWQDSGPRPIAAQWVKPVATAAPPPPPEEVALCNNHLADAKLRGEACDRLIKGGRIAGLQLASAFYGRAWMHQLTNQYDAAIVDYSESLKLNPNNYFALNGRGWMYVNKNELDKAYMDFTRSIEINRSSINAIAFANRGEVLRKQGKLAEAQTDVNEALRLNGTLQMAILVRDSVQADLKRVEEEKSKSPPQQATQPGASAPAAAASTSSADLALCKNASADPKGRGEACDRLIKAGGLAASDLASAHLGRGWMHQRASQFDAAISDYSETLNLEPSNYLALYGRAGMYFQKNELDKALADYTKSLEMKRDALAFATRAEIRRRQSKLSEAVADIAEAVRLDEKMGFVGMVRSAIQADLKRIEDEKNKAPSQPGPATASGGGSSPTSDADAGAARQRGIAAIQQRKWEDAIAAFGMVIQTGSTNPSDFDLRGYAYAMKQQPDNDAAMADFTRAIALANHDWRPHARRAFLFMDRKQMREALNDANAALNDHKANDAGVFILRGRIYLAQSNTDEAWQDFNKAIELAPESAEAYMLRGLASADASRARLDACKRQTERQRNLVGGPCSRPVDFLDSQMDFRTALAKNPKLSQAHFELGRVMQSLNRHQDAVDAYSEAIRISPSYAAAYNNRGVAYNNLKKSEPAFYDYSEAIRHDPRLAVAWANRGDLYANAGQRDDAIGDYRKALSLDDKNQRAIEGLRRLGAR